MAECNKLCQTLKWMMNNYESISEPSQEELRTASYSINLE